jgi:hypothetical protein
MVRWNLTTTEEKIEMTTKNKPVKKMAGGPVPAADGFKKGGMCKFPEKSYAEAKKKLAAGGVAKIRRDQYN